MLNEDSLVWTKGMVDWQVHSFANDIATHMLKPSYPNAGNHRSSRTQSTTPANKPRTYSSVSRSALRFA